MAYAKDKERLDLWLKPDVKKRLKAKADKKKMALTTYVVQILTTAAE